MVGRLRRDRETSAQQPAVRGRPGLLWLGWNGFNGGDPYFASADAAAAVINTNLATAVALMTWLILDMLAAARRSRASSARSTA
jgi:Amt family ammonium transporter